MRSRTCKNADTAIIFHAHAHAHARKLTLARITLVLARMYIYTVPPERPMCACVEIMGAIVFHTHVVVMNGT